MKIVVSLSLRPLDMPELTDWPTASVRLLNSFALKTDLAVFSVLVTKGPVAMQAPFLRESQ